MAAGGDEMAACWAPDAGRGGDEGGGAGLSHVIEAGRYQAADEISGRGQPLSCRCRLNQRCGLCRVAKFRQQRPGRNGRAEWQGGRLGGGLGWPIPDNRRKPTFCHDIAQLTCCRSASIIRVC